MNTMLAAMKYWLPLDISEHGGGVDSLINVVHVFMLALFIPWGVFFVMCLVKFRARPGLCACYEPIKAKPTKYAEIAVIVFELFLLFILSTPVWGAYKRGPAAKGAESGEKPFVVRVVAQQFAWNVQYAGPDGVFGQLKPELLGGLGDPVVRSSEGGADDAVEVNNLTIPKGRPIEVQISSMDVIHSFSIPLLRVKQDAIPGMRVSVWFTATKTSAEVRDHVIRTVSIPDEGEDVARFKYSVSGTVAMEDLSPVVAKGGAVLDSQLADFREAGKEEIKVATEQPVEIHCAQLCGLGHYRMRGKVIILEEKEFDEWYAKLGAEEDFEEGGGEADFDN